MVMKSICVFTGSSIGASSAYKEAADSLGREIARRKLRLVYGGATVGLMGCVADAALSEDGLVLGVLPQALAELEIAHSGLTELQIVDSMHGRKMAMADASDAFIALPGGLGTLEETFEVWTWTQLGLHAKPIGFLNVDGYYDGLFAFLDNAQDAGFIRPKHRQLAVSHTNPAELINLLANADISYEAKLIDKPKR